MVLVTERFPPDVGGSPVLFGNIYTRLGDTALTVLRNGTVVSERMDGALRMITVPMTGGHWGVSSLASLRRYRRMTARLVAECRRCPAVIHCGRTLPEGLAALASTWLGSSARFLCWALGEELQYARSSRELTVLLRRVHRAASAIVAISRSTADALDALHVPREKVHLVHPGVHADRFVRATGGRAIRERYVRDREMLMVTVGRLQRRKGHDLTIEAMASLRDEFPLLRYLIVGDGEERTRLEAAVDAAGLRGRVHFAGAVSENALPDYYAAADLFVHPNRIDGHDVEGFGIVFLEAAAAGLPTIGGANGGSADAVEDGVTGLLVKGTDVAELASAMRTLASSETLRRRMGEAGRERATRHFTWERAAAQVLSIHRSLAQES